MSDAAVTSPIGARLTTWRRRRGLSRTELATRAGLERGLIAGWEAHGDWVDRRGHLASLAAALRLDTTELTGQPYAPHGDEHARVHGFAFRLRRVLGSRRQGSAPSGAPEDPAELFHDAVRADAAGDEHLLALTLPRLIEATDRMVAAGGPGHARASRLRGEVCALGAGLLRRLGYRDLAWLLLRRSRPGQGGPVPAAVPAEEVRLLLDLGSPERALAHIDRADAGGELTASAAVAHAMAGRRHRAEALLSAAAAQAESEREAAFVRISQAVVAAECGDPAEAVARADGVDAAALDGAHRAGLLAVAAAAEARRGRIGAAADKLIAADAAAPMRLRLDPFARELAAALTARTAGTGRERAVRELAERTALL